MSRSNAHQGATSAATGAVGLAATGSPVGGASRIPIFDGVRGFAALSLLTVHIAFIGGVLGFYDQPPSNKVAAMAISSLQLTIGVFFLLTGLFLYRPFARAIITGGRGPVIRHYLLRRALRLLPAYWVMVVAALLLLNFNSIDSLWYVLRPILLLQNYDHVPMAGLDVSWTVPTEMQVYLALPIIAAVSGWYARRSPDPVVRANRLMVPVVLLIVIGLVWMTYIHLPHMGIFPAQYWWPIGMAGNVGIGMALGILSARRQALPDRPPALFVAAGRHPNLFWFGALVMIFLHSLRLFAPAGYGDYATVGNAIATYLLVMAASALIILPMVSVTRETPLMRALLGNRPIVYIGRISYGVYLWHFFAINLYMSNGSIFGADPVLFHFLRGQVGFLELWVATIVITIAIATVSYYVLERPILRFSERYVKGRSAKLPEVRA